MTLSFLEMDRGTWKSRYKPLTVGEGHHQVSGPMPDHSWDRDLSQVEGPPSRECQVIVDPTVDAAPKSLVELGRDVLAELVSQHRPIDVGEQRPELVHNAGSGYSFEVFPRFE